MEASHLGAEAPSVPDCGGMPASYTDAEEEKITRSIVVPKVESAQACCPHLSASQQGIRDVHTEQEGTPHSVCYVHN